MSFKIAVQTVSFAALTTCISLTACMSLNSSKAKAEDGAIVGGGAADYKYEAKCEFVKGNSGYLFTAYPPPSIFGDRSNSMLQTIDMCGNNSCEPTILKMFSVDRLVRGTILIYQTDGVEIKIDTHLSVGGDDRPKLRLLHPRVGFDIYRATGQFPATSSLTGYCIFSSVGI